MTPKTISTTVPADPAAPAAPRAADPRKGTEEMPMPSQTETVAGMPRAGRVMNEPGDAGVIAGEDDVLDTSHLPEPGEDFEPERR
ncbi:hypothetical protein CEG14_03475 [Bordetella genomosp. 1]|uniref:Uncharacterized protein n=1 Tax=Bordetella genomosp. 1 TaxID=1395607 RepID=A0A261SUR0_9BORD|nr:hypothetical protein [Bordetella genomosp. 1]MDQ8032200.1 hypothetical protein [Bordetella sp.]OZI40831.1 hypothetical protein CEG14_03475 [Bordetella genomosp. 1]